MKIRLIVAGLVAAMFIGSFAACGAMTLENEKDKTSYSVGFQIGSDFAEQSLDINPDVFLQGIKDAMAKTEPLMSPEDMQATLKELKKKIVAAMEQKRKETAERNLKDGETFLAENKTKEGVVTLPSGLQYKVIKEGSGAMPKKDDSVTVNYRGTLLDGTEFDSSYKRNQPATFQVGKVIPGWTEALQLMKEGSKWQLFIPANLAYGARGAGNVIEPNSTLIFDVELISLKAAETKAE